MKKVSLYCLFQKVEGEWIRVLGPTLPYKEACLYYRIWFLHSAIFPEVEHKLFIVKKGTRKKIRRRSLVNIKHLRDKE